MLSLYRILERRLTNKTTNICRINNAKADRSVARTHISCYNFNMKTWLPYLAIGPTGLYEAFHWSNCQCICVRVQGTFWPSA